MVGLGALGPRIYGAAPDPFPSVLLEIRRGHDLLGWLDFVFATYFHSRSTQNKWGWKKKGGGGDTIYFYFIFNQQLAQKMRGHSRLAQMQIVLGFGERAVHSLQGQDRGIFPFKEGTESTSKPSPTTNKEIKLQGGKMSLSLFVYFNANKTEENCKTQLKHFKALPFLF